MKRKHLQTDFIKFLREKYSQEEEEENTPPEPIEDEPIEISDTDEETEDEPIEELLNEYKKLKKEYEYRKLFNRK